MVDVDVEGTFRCRCRRCLNGVRILPGPSAFGGSVPQVPRVDTCKQPTMQILGGLAQGPWHLGLGPSTRHRILSANRGALCARTCLIPRPWEEGRRYYCECFAAFRGLL